MRILLLRGTVYVPCVMREARIGGVQVALAKVFIVDDDEAVRESLKLLLESYGFAVDDYASPEDFLRRYRPGRRQCLILDQHLPALSGLDFLASAEAATLELPVILITGRGDSSIRERARALGVIAYFDKPAAGDDLIAAIAEAVGGLP
jgi:two-component system response regulator FixJ